MRAIDQKRRGNRFQLLNIRIPAHFKTSLDLLSASRSESIARIVRDAITFADRSPASVPPEPKWGQVDCVYLSVEVPRAWWEMAARHTGWRPGDRVTVSAPWIREAIRRYVEQLRSETAADALA